VRVQGRYKGLQEGTKGLHKGTELKSRGQVFEGIPQGWQGRDRRRGIETSSLACSSSCAPSGTTDGKKTRLQGFDLRTAKKLAN